MKPSNTIIIVLYMCQYVCLCMCACINGVNEPRTLVGRYIYEYNVACVTSRPHTDTHKSTAQRKALYIYIIVSRPSAYAYFALRIQANNNSKLFFNNYLFCYLSYILNTNLRISRSSRVKTNKRADQKREREKTKV